MTDHSVPGFAEAHRRQGERFPGTAGRWQPVHTVYVPADRVTPGTVSAWGSRATELMERHLATSAELDAVFAVGPHAADVHGRVVRKLAAEPVEDLRIDFEDGYGVRPDAEEDRHVRQAAAAVAAMHGQGTLPRRWGLRVKSFADGDPGRSLRTLDGFLTEVIAAAGGLPDGFTVTFPKVLMPDYLRQFTKFLEKLENALGLTGIRYELQVEAPQTVVFLPTLVPDERLAAAHFGVFDYTAACGLPPHEQRLDHPVCDHARHVMQTVFAGTGVELSDGSLAAVPAGGRTEDVHALWRRHAELVRHSLAHGFYQGWDMHPSHLVSRYVTVYAFHLARYAEYRDRVAAWQARREAAGGVLDEPATVKTLVAALARAESVLGVDHPAPVPHQAGLHGLGPRGADRAADVEGPDAVAE